MPAARASRGEEKVDRLAAHSNRRPHPDGKTPVTILMSVLLTRAVFAQQGVNLTGPQIK